MVSTPYYERRKENKEIVFRDRRVMQRRLQHKFVSLERRRLGWQVRRCPRESLAIPIHINRYEREIAGITCDIGPKGLRIWSEAALSPGTLLKIEFCFEKDVCYLKLSGQVIYCHPTNHGSSFYNEMGIQMCNLKEMDEKLLEVSVQGLKHSDHIEESSFINVYVLSDFSQNINDL